MNIKTAGRNGDVVALALCRDGDDMMFITRNGMIVRSSVTDVRPMGRGTQGVRLVNLKSGDRLVGAEIIGAEDIALVNERNGDVDPPEEAEGESTKAEEPDVE